MKLRIYKQLLNGKETIDTYTIWFKPTKKAAQNGAIINAFCCNVIDGKVEGYWEDYPANTRVHLDIRVGRYQKPENVPTPIMKWAKCRIKIFAKACKTDDWRKWNMV